VASVRTPSERILVDEVLDIERLEAACPKEEVRLDFNVGGEWGVSRIFKPIVCPFRSVGECPCAREATRNG
jgi:hypothetical protein